MISAFGVDHGVISKEYVSSAWTPQQKKIAHNTSTRSKVMGPAGLASTAGLALARKPRAALAVGGTTLAGVVGNAAIGARRINNRDPRNPNRRA